MLHTADRDEFAGTLNPDSAGGYGPLRRAHAIACTSSRRAKVPTASGKGGLPLTMACSRAFLFADTPGCPAARSGASRRQLRLLRPFATPGVGAHGLRGEWSILPTTPPVLARAEKVSRRSRRPPSRHQLIVVRQGILEISYEAARAPGLPFCRVHGRPDNEFACAETNIWPNWYRLQATGKCSAEKWWEPLCA